MTAVLAEVTSISIEAVPAPAAEAEDGDTTLAEPEAGQELLGSVRAWTEAARLVVARDWRFLNLSPAPAAGAGFTL